MAHILHYNEIDGSGEYIILTEEDNTEETREEFCHPGYVFYQAYELGIDDLGTLPADRPLFPN